MLILTDNQETIIKRTISNKIHDILKGKIKSNFDAVTLDGQFFRGYHIPFKKGLLRLLEIELNNITDYHFYFSVCVFMRNNQKHTFYIKVSRKTNKIEYRTIYNM